MKLKRAKIVIRSVSQIKKEWTSILSGDVRDLKPQNQIIFTTLGDFARTMTPARLELLEVIFRAKPESIYALAKLVGRDFKNVHSDVKILKGIGFIDLKNGESRDALIPVAKYSGFEIDLAA